MKIFVLSQLEEFLSDSSCFSPVRDPLEAGVDEFILFKWGKDAVSGHSGDEAKGWELVDKVHTS